MWLVTQMSRQCKHVQVHDRHLVKIRRSAVDQFELKKYVHIEPCLNIPGPLAPPGRSRPRRNITARSYSWTTCTIVKETSIAVYPCIQRIEVIAFGTNIRTEARVIIVLIITREPRRERERERAVVFTELHRPPMCTYRCLRPHANCSGSEACLVLYPCLLWPQASKIPCPDIWPDNAYLNVNSTSSSLYGAIGKKIFSGPYTFCLFDIIILFSRLSLPSIPSKCCWLFTVKLIRDK